MNLHWHIDVHKEMLKKSMEDQLESLPISGEVIHGRINARYILKQLSGKFNDFSFFIIFTVMGKDYSLKGHCDECGVEWDQYSTEDGSLLGLAGATSIAIDEADKRLGFGGHNPISFVLSAVEDAVRKELGCSGLQCSRYLTDYRIGNGTEIVLDEILVN
jgi:hypothetical protein